MRGECCLPASLFSTLRKNVLEHLWHLVLHPSRLCLPQAEELKNKGNAAFQAKNYGEAVEHFTAAIALDSANHVLYSNRSACYASLQRYDDALKDAEHTIQLKPQWAKVHTTVPSLQPIHYNIHYRNV